MPYLVLAAFIAVFAVQMLAPFPYEDYQVPIMPLLAIFAAVAFVSGGGDETAADRAARGPYHRSTLLVFGLAYACAFGSPLLEKWTTNGQDRFWSIKKQSCELAQLREMAKAIEAIDPGGKTLLTQDTYLAVECGRSVPKGLEMGPFSVLDDAEWRELLDSAPCPVAALSGYTFAVNPPKCDERPTDQQLEYWNLLKKHYRLEFKEDNFGQNSTPLLILTRRGTDK